MERQEEVSVRDLFTEQPLVPGSAAGLGVEPGIPASPVPPGTRRPCSATAAGSQSGKHVPRRGREDVCRAPRAQSGEPACVPASRRAAASRPPSGDATSSTLPSRGLSGTEAPGRPPAQPVPARSPPARACCPASQVPQGGLLGEQWGRGQTRARGPDPGPPRAARVPLVRVPSQGRTEPAWAPRGPPSASRHPRQAAPRGASAPAWERPPVPGPPLRGGRRGAGSAEGGGPGGRVEPASHAKAPPGPAGPAATQAPAGRPPPRSPPHPHGVLCRGEGGPRNQQKDKSEGVVMAVGGPGRAERPGAQRGTGRRRAAAGGRGGGAAREGRRHRDSEPSPERDPPSRARVPAPRAPSVQTDARCTCVVPCRGQVCACGRAAERGRVCAGVCTSVALRWGGRPEPVL